MKESKRVKLIVESKRYFEGERKFQKEYQKVIKKKEQRSPLKAKRRGKKMN